MKSNLFLIWVLGALLVLGCVVCGSPEDADGLDQDENNEANNDFDDDEGDEDAQCEAFFECIFEVCGEEGDANCLRGCADDLQAQQASAAENAIECIEGNGCGLEDEDCLEDACASALVALEEACEGGEGEGDNNDVADDFNGAGQILAIGDSIFEWNSEDNASIPDVIASALNRTVVNASVGGALLSAPEPDAGEFDIRNQYRDRGWEWLVMDGGGNDANDECGCGDCGALMDEMISQDGLSGDIPDFVRSVTASGTKVMYMGYYEVPSDAEFGFDRCDDELAEHSARLERMAQALDGVFFVDAREVVTANNTEAYDEDRVHPSVAGSALVGNQIARAIEAAQGR